MIRLSERLTLERLEDRTLLSTCHVTRMSDAGMGMGFRGDLRYCIDKVNANPGADIIDFHVTGTINLTSVLPDLSSDMEIRGPARTFSRSDACPAAFIESSTWASARKLRFRA